MRRARKGGIVIVQISLGRARFYRQMVADRLGPRLMGTEYETGQDGQEICCCRRR